MKLTDFEKKRAGRYLRRFIEDHFDLIKEFAAFVGVHPCTVTTWMNGRSPMPIEIIDRLLVTFPEDLPYKILRPDLYSQPVKRY